jgi:CRISPR-associated endonuclease/helicase Cas3
MQFRTAAGRFQIIDDKAQRPTLVPYRKGKELIELLKSKGPERWLMRKLQRYSVNVYLCDFGLLEKKGAIDCICGKTGDSGIYAVNNDVGYDRVLGLLVDDPPDNLDLFIQ